MPPPASSATEQLASRIFLGPALRTQPDRRLVTLVREGYEAAFEEIVRRYRKPLDNFAASFVGGRSEDVCQDAFSKALLALRGSENEIELRPWLYRIVRNTALNDVRDNPPATAELGEETLAGARSAAEEVERREELTELTDRLRALPEPQRAAIVMRELEGLSHEEIAAALGMSGGGARQAIYRGRQALRDGFGLLLPLPLLRLLAEHGAGAAGAGAGGAVAAGAAGVAAGGAGAGGALKVGLATALIAGSVGAGVAVEQNQRGHDGGGNAAAAQPAAASTAAEAEGGSASSGNGGGPGPAPGPAVSVSARAEDRRGDGSDDAGHGTSGEVRGARDGGGDGNEGFEPGRPPRGPGPGHAHGGRGPGPDRDEPGAILGGRGPGQGSGGPGRGHGETGGPSPSGDSGRGGGPGPSGPESQGPSSGPRGGGAAGDGGGGSGHPSGSGSGGGHVGSGGGDPGGGSPTPPPASPLPPPEEGQPGEPGGGGEEDL